MSGKEPSPQQDFSRFKKNFWRPAGNFPTIMRGAKIGRSLRPLIIFWQKERNLPLGGKGELSSEEERAESLEKAGV